MYVNVGMYVLYVSILTNMSPQSKACIERYPPCQIFVVRLGKACPPSLRLYPILPLAQANKQAEHPAKLLAIFDQGDVMLDLDLLSKIINSTYISIYSVVG